MISMKTIVTCRYCGLEVAADSRFPAECPRCGRMVSADGATPVHEASVSLCPVGAAGPGHVDVVNLPAGVHTIGRRSDKSDATVQLDVHDFFMSKRHAMIAVGREPAGGVTVTVGDAGSSNGTFVNDRRLGPGEQMRVADGDVLRLGNTMFRLSINSF